MKYNLPCELVRDLFPSYIDGLTNDVTNEAVEEHLAECESCRNILETMKEPAEDPVESEDETEIDFLKKTRNTNRKYVYLSFAAAVCIMALVILAKIFFIGGYIKENMLACKVSVEGNHLSLRGSVKDSEFGISKVKYSEKDGTVTVSCKAVRKSIFHKDEEYQADYEAAGEIEQVRLDDRILWENGEEIDAVTSEVYQTKHAYIGDMPENFQTATALNQAENLGAFTNELQTSKEPYGWKLLLEEDIPKSRRKGKEELMKSYACVLLAVIDNLGEVSYEYRSNGTVYTLSVQEDEASGVAGQNIKECGQDIVQLQKLMEKTELVR